MLHWAPTQSIFRVYAEGKSYPHDPNIGVVNCIHSVAMAVIFGAHCEVLSRNDLRFIVKTLYDLGVRDIYALRGEGHTLPCASLVTDGHMKGYYHINIGDAIAEHNPKASHVHD